MSTFRSLFRALIFAITAIGLSSCATPMPWATYLTTDAHTEPSYRSLIAGEINISVSPDIPKTLFDPYKLRLIIIRVDGPPGPGNMFYVYLPITETQKRQRRVAVPFVLEATPGEYDLRSIVADGVVGEDDPLFLLSESGGPTDGPVFIFRVPDGAIVSLGRIDINVTKASAYYYRLSIANQNATDHNVGLAYAARRYPKLFKDYEKKIVLVRH